MFIGATLRVADEEKRILTVDLTADEALETSEIEGEILSRESLQSSLRRQFGLPTDNRQIPPAALQALAYLASLQGAKRDLAEQYIRRTPRQVDTTYRRLFEAELGWTAI